MTAIGHGVGGYAGWNAGAVKGWAAMAGLENEGTAYLVKDILGVKGCGDIPICYYVGNVSRMKHGGGIHDAK
jgi:hypothetical protein